MCPLEPDGPRGFAGSKPSNGSDIRPDDGFPFELTILVIDDEEDSAKLLELLLKKTSCRILWAPDSREGLSKAVSARPDLVVIDLHMPGLSGQEICRRLREQEQSIYLPILILTGDGGAEIECINIGADGYLRKDQSVELLLARVLNLIRRRRYNLQNRGLARIGGVELDPRRHVVTIARRKHPIGLTQKEAGLILLLMSAEGRLVSSQELHQKTSKGALAPRSSTMRAHISHIRRKLGVHGRLIRSVGNEEAFCFDVAYALSLTRPADGATTG